MDYKDLNNTAGDGADKEAAPRRRALRSVPLSGKTEAASGADKKPSAQPMDETRVFSIAPDSDTGAKVDSITVDDIENILTKHFHEKEQRSAELAQKSTAPTPQNKVAANGYVRPNRPSTASMGAAKQPAQNQRADKPATEKRLDRAAIIGEPTLKDVYSKRSSDFTPDNGYRGNTGKQSNGYVRPSSNTQPATQARTERSPQPTSAARPQNVPEAQKSEGGALKKAVRQPAVQRPQTTSASQSAQAQSNPQRSSDNSSRRAASVYSGLGVSENTVSAPAVKAGSNPGGEKDRFVRAGAEQKKKKTNNAKKIGRKKADAEEPKERTALSSALKAMIYIIAVIGISVFLSFVIIYVGNDVFAFVKPNAEYDISIDEGDGISDVAQLLADRGVIEYPGIFELYAKLRKKDSGFVGGTYTVSPSMNYDTLIASFKGKTVEKTQISITIPEGYTVDDIITLFVDGYGIGTRERFVEVIQNYDFSYYWFIEELETRPDRKYRLEGYLFPDTYYFFSDSNEETVIDKLLTNFNRKFDESFRNRCTDLGMTVDEVVTVASMIQAEGKYASEYSTISSVFHNRLSNPAVTNGKLESDATIRYSLDLDTVTPEDNDRDDPYNTYLYDGLPPGPISNPSLNALTYALYPAETDYYYFVAQANGYSLFAKTLTEHNANIAAIIAAREDE